MSCSEGLKGKFSFCYNAGTKHSGFTVLYVQTISCPGFRQNRGILNMLISCTGNCTSGNQYSPTTTVLYGHC